MRRLFYRPPGVLWALQQCFCAAQILFFEQSNLHHFIQLGKSFLTPFTKSRENGLKIIIDNVNDNILNSAGDQNNFLLLLIEIKRRKAEEERHETKDSGGVARATMFLNLAAPSLAADPSSGSGGTAPDDIG